MKKVQFYLLNIYPNRGHPLAVLVCFLGHATLIRRKDNANKIRSNQPDCLLLLLERKV